MGFSINNIEREMKMYYSNPDSEAVRRNMRNDHAITIAQLQHLASLVAEGKRPNGNYGDAECLAWEVLKNLSENPDLFK